MLLSSYFDGQRLWASRCTPRDAMCACASLGVPRFLVDCIAARKSCTPVCAEHVCAREFSIGRYIPLLSCNRSSSPSLDASGTGRGVCGSTALLALGEHHGRGFVGRLQRPTTVYEFGQDGRGTTRAHTYEFQARNTQISMLSLGAGRVERRARRRATCRCNRGVCALIRSNLCDHIIRSVVRMKEMN